MEEEHDHPLTWKQSQELQRFFVSPTNPDVYRKLLTRKGYIYRVPNSWDRRLTNKGRAKARSIRSQLSEKLARLTQFATLLERK